MAASAGNGMGIIEGRPFTFLEATDLGVHFYEWLTA